MATGPEAVKAMADAGLPFATVEAVARYLRQAGLWPKSGRGGGKAAVHVEAHHLTNLGLGLAAHLPIDAPEAVRTLRGLVEQDTTKTEPVEGPFGLDHMYRDTTEAAVTRESPSTLGNMMDMLIRRVTQVGGQVRVQWDYQWNVLEAAALILDPSGTGSAHLSRRLPHGGLEMTSYSGPEQLPLPTHQGEMERLLLQPRIDARRQFRLPFTFLFVAAEIVANTTARRGDNLFPPPNASAPSGDYGDGDGASSAEAKPETKNGASGALPGATEAPSNTGVRPRVNGTTYAHSAQNNQRQKISQPVSGRGRLDTSSQLSASRRRRLGVSDHAHAVP